MGLGEDELGICSVVEFQEFLNALVETFVFVLYQHGITCDFIV